MDLTKVILFLPMNIQKPRPYYMNIYITDTLNVKHILTRLSIPHFVHVPIMTKYMIPSLDKFLYNIFS